MEKCWGEVKIDTVKAAVRVCVCMYVWVCATPMSFYSPGVSTKKSGWREE